MLKKVAIKVYGSETSDSFSLCVNRSTVFLVISRSLLNEHADTDSKKNQIRSSFRTPHSNPQSLNRFVLECNDRRFEWDWKKYCSCKKEGVLPGLFDRHVLYINFLARRGC
ncbi:hypothetical protein AVEN_198947-1 [Araneus ventricosus]|uniref:Uncharacterized protein n=1 Tax=Araneus ventricosus TaxID=182803 RepID=A0A4Y2RC89_ARAVE|nr:hypothetical protein AVEN_198947-1 [Araneus ventricosus]